jgi:hypothetical protein
MDVANNTYSESFQGSYDYSLSTVSVQYNLVGETFTGVLTATNLKPNFAYQLKLVGTPGTDDNERIGLAGRWWEQEWLGTSWSDGANLNNKGDGYTSPNDATYFAHRDIKDGTSDTGYHYKHTGYLVFAYFITDSNGDAEVVFESGDCCHVLWMTTQRTRTGDDGPLKTWSFDPDISEAAYDVDYSSSTVSIFGEWERLPMGEVDLQPGSYACQIVLTEESFHGTDPLEGTWATVMGADISFTITD